MTDCYCGSGRPFQDCCGPIIGSKAAPTAEALMRSRYAAYCIADAAYIHQTAHPKVQDQYRFEDIQNWAKENQWTKLEIIQTEKGRSSDKEGIVEFKAHFIAADGKAHIHHERSVFLKEDGKWFYLEGSYPKSAPIQSNKISRNDPCPCGSGKKFKKCCG
ncbi:YchJ family protein [Echinicola salinicaeni]|uniref:YchJ family protein n=1 Tax=Echinicola salinicaeni TaxID=2762757 RepID=UPI001644D6C0|nr:YchJ family protein [Echinicola salinicaeni]